jgi:hypothetical protein
MAGHPGQGQLHLTHVVRFEQTGRLAHHFRQGTSP